MSSSLWDSCDTRGPGPTEGLLPGTQTGISVRDPSPTETGTVGPYRGPPLYRESPDRSHQLRQGTGVVSASRRPHTPVGRPDSWFLCPTPGHHPDVSVPCGSESSRRVSWGPLGRWTLTDVHTKTELPVRPESHLSSKGPLFRARKEGVDLELWFLRYERRHFAGDGWRLTSPGREKGPVSTDPCSLWGTWAVETLTPVRLERRNKTPPDRPQ